MRSCYICLILVWMFYACTPSYESSVWVEDADFREGDLVLRCGWGMESQAVVESSNSVYSHIGMLHYDSLSALWMVIHAVPGEAEKGEPEYLKYESLSDFYAPDRAKCGAWMRIDCSDSIASSAVLYALGKVRGKVTFDNDYLLSDTTQLYCTELVYQAYLHQGLDITDGHRRDLPVILCKDGEGIFPIDIEESSHVLFVQPFQTKKLKN